jgi:hypothetical protein
LIDGRLPALTEVAEQHIGQAVSRGRNFKWAFSLKKLEDFAYEPGPPVSCADKLQRFDHPHPWA